MRNNRKQLFTVYAVKATVQHIHNRKDDEPAEHETYLTRVPGRWSSNKAEAATFDIATAKQIAKDFSAWDSSNNNYWQCSAIPIEKMCYP